MKDARGITIAAATLPALVALVALLVLVTSAVPAGAEGPIQVGIQPAGRSASTDRGAYFTYTLEPEASIDDEAMVTNSGEDAVTLRLYAADGVTAINGSTAFAAADETRTGVRSWLSTTISELVIPAGQGANVPFRVTVPADAAPGDHVAGWIVEAPPKPVAAGGVGATILERAGVAVVVRVPGSTEERLALDAICLNQETGSNYFEVPARNEGNVLTRGSGTFTLATPDGLEVFVRPAELGTVLPGDATFLRLDAPFDPGPGDYVATLALEQPDGQKVKSSSPIKIGTDKVNGCTAVAAAEMKGQRGFLSLTDGATPWLLVGLLGGLLAGLVAARTFLTWRRRPDEIKRG